MEIRFSRVNEDVFHFLRARAISNHGYASDKTMSIEAHKALIEYVAHLQKQN